MLKKKEIYMSHRAVVRETSHKQQNYAQLIMCQQTVVLKHAIKWVSKICSAVKKRLIWDILIISATLSSEILK